tara:strand:- start:76 stop:288 length:213 start_codon:yes stop_codon:yes gene_type:complete
MMNHILATRGIYGFNATNPRMQHRDGAIIINIVKIVKLELLGHILSFIGLNLTNGLIFIQVSLVSADIKK